MIIWQTTDVRLNRCYILCYNVDPVFTHNFNLPKAKVGGEFTIKFMDSAFDKEKDLAEFFLEFKEAVVEKKVAEQFVAMGATSVILTTFEHNDGNESAANALLRVWDLAEKTGIQETRGECSNSLKFKTLSKQAERKETMSNKELDEKTQIALKTSLDDLNGKVVEVREEVGEVLDDVKNIGGKVDAMQHCVVTIIPDYQKENQSLKLQLVHKTKECDRIEGQKAHQTRIINMQNGKIDSLESRVKILEEKEAIWNRERAAFAESEAVWKEEKTIFMQSLKNREETSKAISDAKEIVNIVESERAAKRARTA